MHVGHWMVTPEGYLTGAFTSIHRNLAFVAKLSMDKFTPDWALALPVGTDWLTRMDHVNTQCPIYHRRYLWIFTGSSETAVAGASVRFAIRKDVKFAPFTTTRIGDCLRSPGSRHLRSGCECGWFKNFRVSFVRHPRRVGAHLEPGATTESFVVQGISAALQTDGSASDWPESILPPFRCMKS